MLDGRDVHMLGYFIDIADAAFQRFLAAQRAVAHRPARSDRRAPGGAGHAGEARARRWRWRGCSRACRSAARRWRARWSPPATSRDMHEAFDRWLGTGRPAFVPRVGPPPEEVDRRSSTPPAARRRSRIRAGRRSTTARRRCTRPASTRSRCITPITMRRRSTRYAALAARARPARHRRLRLPRSRVGAAPGRRDAADGRTGSGCWRAAGGSERHRDGRHRRAAPAAARRHAGLRRPAAAARQGARRCARGSGWRFSGWIRARPKCW